MNYKLIGVLVGVAVVSTVAVKVLQSMSDKVDKGEVAKDVAATTVESVKDQVFEDDEY
ncbi:MAG TPA: hypothetical protein VFC83_02065 [Erysipelotrichaceae bacterium]|nr:hypothetical protein [Erysipelotrichaceae bacterium]